MNRIVLFLRRFMVLPFVSIALFSTNSVAQEVRFKVPELTVLLSSESIRVQQQLVQRIRLESSYPFEKLNVVTPEPSDVRTVELQPRTTRQFKTWANQGWVFETSRALFSIHSGEMVVPEIRIDGVTRLPDGTDQSFELSSPAVRVRVDPPAPELIGEPWLVAKQVDIEEQWSVVPDLLRAGQIATRTILVRAQGATAEHISPVKMAASLGIAVLPGKITRKTEVTDDGVVGRMEQAFEVRILSDAKTDISPVQIAWFDSSRQVASRAAVRAYRIEPLPANVDEITRRIVDQAHQERLDSSRKLMWTVVGTCIALSLFLVVLLLFTQARSRLRNGFERVASMIFGPLMRLPAVGIEASDQQSSGWRHGDR